MNNDLKKLLQRGYTPYQSCEEGAALLESSGFKRVTRSSLPSGKSKYFLIEDGCLTAVNASTADSLMIVGSHTDSPALRLKSGLIGGERLNCEVYGGAINYTFFDTPLKICGRVLVETRDGVRAKSVVSDYRVTVPSLAVHQNRGVNGGFAPTVQGDMTPLIGAHPDFIERLSDGEKVIGYDLYACPDVEPYESGLSGEYLCSPRIDNLTSVYASLKALTLAKPKGIAVCVCFNGEEVGSKVRRGAAASFFPSLLSDIYLRAGGKNFKDVLDCSLMLSADNAHAAHPSHPEKSDPVAKVVLGGGVVVKHHTNYATDGLTEAVAKKLFAAANVPVQDFYSQSDLPCGSTIGLMAAAATDIRTCDIGIAQLAMHSACETCALSDIDAMTAACTAFFSSEVQFSDGGATIKK